MGKNIKIPSGFEFSVAEAAIKKPGRKDMALIYSKTDAVVAGAFTTNRVKAAPVRLDMKRVKLGKGRAVVVNSGNANACTGNKGMKDAEESARLAAFYLNIPENLVYVASTGVIGVPLPMERLKEGIKELARRLGEASPEEAARAIMTTDTFPKIVSKTVKIGSKTGTILGFCKGAGMIRPNMATMLCFILTDVAVNRIALEKALKEGVLLSFNRITVEGDMSTNDTVLALSNGVIGNRAITPFSKEFGLFKKALHFILYELSKMVVSDGEGSTKFVEIEVNGAKNDADAKKAAMAVANSFLVKTAIYGKDPNWGRIMAAIGYSGAEIIEERTSVSIGGVKVAARGVSTGKEAEARKELSKKEIKIVVALGIGSASAKVLTCDITEEMVRLNSDYTT